MTVKAQELVNPQALPLYHHVCMKKKKKKKRKRSFTGFWWETIDKGAEKPRGGLSARSSSVQVYMQPHLSWE